MKERAFAPLVNVSLEDLMPADHFYCHLDEWGEGSLFGSHHDGRLPESIRSLLSLGSSLDSTLVRSAKSRRGTSHSRERAKHMQ